MIQMQKFTLPQDKQKIKADLVNKCVFLMREVNPAYLLIPNNY